VKGAARVGLLNDALFLLCYLTHPIRGMQKARSRRPQGLLVGAADADTTLP
jgi:hypothetical protein